MSVMRERVGVRGETVSVRRETVSVRETVGVRAERQ